MGIGIALASRAKKVGILSTLGSSIGVGAIGGGVGAIYGAATADANTSTTVARRTAGTAAIGAFAGFGARALLGRISMGGFARLFVRQTPAAAKARGVAIASAMDIAEGPLTRKTIAEVGMKGLQQPGIRKAMDIAEGPLTPWMQKKAGLGGIFEAGPITKAGKFVGSAIGAGVGVGKWAYRHPTTAIGMAGAGLGMYALAQTGPQPSGMNADIMAQMAAGQNFPSTGFPIGMGTEARQEARAMFMDSTIGLTQGLHRGRHR